MSDDPSPLDLMEALQDRPVEAPTPVLAKSIKLPSNLALVERIRCAEANKQRAEQAVLAHHHILNTLYAERYKCAHVWVQPIPGLEHEGGHCELCGINEVYARSNDIGNCEGVPN